MTIIFICILKEVGTFLNKDATSFRYLGNLQQLVSANSITYLTHTILAESSHTLTSFINHLYMSRNACNFEIYI